MWTLSGDVQRNNKWLIMTTNVDCIPAAILKDVVAYVDVWSSSKTENYSKPFIELLQEMGAEVTKRFNKQVTHVVFKNGHQATWNRAKKTGVRLVSVLWVERCKDEGEQVDEELCPALNEEGNPAFKKRTHRCMQPRETPEKTPDGDKRMKKKLDKMMKDLVPAKPLITDVSPFIIDEDNGIVYSPTLKRSDSMAKRLKVMKEKREKLSPTASQLVESELSSDWKPSLGSTPTCTFLQVLDNESYDDFRSSSGDLVRSGKKHKTQQKRWQSPCSDVPPKQKSSIYSVPGLSDEAKESKESRKPRKTSVKIVPVKVDMIFSSPVNCSPKGRHNGQSVLESDSLGNRKHGCSSSASKELKSTFSNSRRTKSNANNELEIESIPSCSETSTFTPESGLPQNMSGDIFLPLLKEGEQRSKRTRPSVSAIAQSSADLVDSPSTVNTSTEEEQDVFDDFFSPANHPQRQCKEPLSRCLSLGTMVQIPFKLESSPRKRKKRRSVSAGSTLTQVKRRKQDEKLDTNKHSCQPANVSSVLDQQVPLSKAAKWIPTSTDHNNIITTLAKKLIRQSSLSFAQMNESSTGSVMTKPSLCPATSKPCVTVAGEDLEEHRSPDHLGTVGRGTECDAADTAAMSERICEQKRQVNEKAKRMDTKTKTMRTLVMTSMPTEKQHIVIQVVKNLGGFSVVESVCESTTHVVSGGHKRTLNVLLGIARGCWILSFKWILWCLEQRQWIPEEPYELSDHFPAAPICRLQQHLSAGEHQQDLFLSQPTMFVSQLSQPPRHSLAELIQLCGGTVCKTVRQAGLCIGEHRGKRPEGSKILSEQWVLDCITYLKQLPYDNYELE
ncbi:microcephalin isoform X1 [Osmerus eperlanus]|uniref:microcephalin isoform X1 n=2 Tax=Osmerus eperlanus TaxID=29151 RepID=UPI002E0E0FB3